MTVAVTAQGAMCGKCHGDYVRTSAFDWVHGPVALGECGLCHLPHRSLIAGLLTKPVPDLCLSCHLVLGIPDRPYHRPAATGQIRACTDCHDPHMAGNRLLLSDARSLARRKSRGAIASTHKPFDQHKCTVCHVAGRQNEIVEKLDAVCVSCHEKVPAEAVAAPGKLHEAVRTGHCVNCHDPHKSPRPHLVRTTGERMCFSCHKLADIAKPNHPATASADCSICHAGHKSDRPHLLRPGVPESAAGMGQPPWRRPD
jgi:predicted CXXCH cytochrome family protein